MRKTNIQLDGKFLSYKDEKYYMSNITDINKWIEKETIDETNDVTEEIIGLIEKYDIKHSVNFLRSQSGGWGMSVKPQSGGWGMSVKSQSGGWGMSVKSQSGGWPPMSQKGGWDINDYEKI